MPRRSGDTSMRIRTSHPRTTACASRRVFALTRQQLRRPKLWLAEPTLEKCGKNPLALVAWHERLELGRCPLLLHC
eukprot:2250840-Rhodomonas_salina.1